MKSLVLIGLVLLAFPAPGQEIKNVPLPSSTPSYAYDCSKLPYDSPGCKSYNEMIAKKDKDVLGALSGSGAGTVYVCFRRDSFDENHDVFFIASASAPDNLVPTAPKSSFSSTPGYFSYQRFKDGEEDDQEFLLGKWTKFGTMDPTFIAQNNPPDTSATADEGQIAYTNSFKNLAGTTTAYNMQIRRSTLRFSESYTFPQMAAQNRKTAATAASPQMRSDITGYCADFNHD